MLNTEGCLFERTACCSKVSFSWGLYGGFIPTEPESNQIPVLATLGVKPMHCGALQVPIVVSCLEMGQSRRKSRSKSPYNIGHKATCKAKAANFLFRRHLILLPDSMASIA